MGDTTGIAWTDHTFNPWVGCTKVAPGCVNCYAEADMDKRRHFAVWGLHGTRVKTSPANWVKPLKWNQEAMQAGVRHRVFCSSLADVFEDWKGQIHSSQKISDDWSEGQKFQPVLWWRDDIGVCRAGQTTMTRCRGDRPATMDDLRRELFALIDATPWLDWQLLTKRPENIARMWHNHIDTFDQDEADIEGATRRKNVWLGTSISDQKTADVAIPELLRCRDLSPVLFLSAEPLLGPVDLGQSWAAFCEAEGYLLPSTWFGHLNECPNCEDGRSPTGDEAYSCQTCTGTCWAPGIDWVIAGGESGSHARECNMVWIKNIAMDCHSAGVPVFVKQLGARPVHGGETIGWPKHVIAMENNAQELLGFKDKKHGGDPGDWIPGLRVQQFPIVAPVAL